MILSIPQLPLFASLHCRVVHVMRHQQSLSREYMRKKQTGKCQSSWHGRTLVQLQRVRHKILTGALFLKFTFLDQGYNNKAINEIVVGKDTRQTRANISTQKAESGFYPFRTTHHSYSLLKYFLFQKYWGVFCMREKPQNVHLNFDFGYKSPQTTHHCASH